MYACNTNSYSHKECYNNNYHYTINNSVGTMTTYQYPPGMQSVQSIGVQCNLLAAPPLQKLSKAEEEIDRQIISDSEDADVYIISDHPGRYHNRVSTSSYSYTCK